MTKGIIGERHVMNFAGFVLSYVKVLGRQVPEIEIADWTVRGGIGSVGGGGSSKRKRAG